MEPDEASRVRLSAQPETSPAVLRSLATDSSVTVRATLAMNPSAPPDANAALARDPDERVRALLARKLCSLAPSLSGKAHARLRRETQETLMALAEDEAVRVRAVIADVVKDLADVPRALILRLAHDRSETVCEPVIRFSPLLTTGDLLALVAAAPSAATRLAVASRPGIGAEISDALVAHGTDDVVTALLTNGSAQIREMTLDALVGRSVDHPAWQEPLVRRPALSPWAIKTLSQIVADHLLEVLASRGDLDPLLASELRDRVNARLGVSRPGVSRPGVSGIASRDAPPAAEKPLAKPTETEMMAVLRDGDACRAILLLAAAAEVPKDVVQRAATLRSAKGLISLAWKAGFSMKTGYALEVSLARLSPGVALKPGPGNSFPLSIQEMRWQLDFLSGGGR